MKKTIEEVQAEIEKALQRLPAFAAQLPEDLRALTTLLPPSGTRVKVSLRHVKGDRQVKRTAPADAWSADSGRVQISYEACEDQKDNASDTHLAKANAKAAPSAASIGQPVPAPAQRAISADAPPSNTPSGTMKPHGLLDGPVQDLLRTLAGAEQDPHWGFVALKWFRDAYLPQQGFAWAETPENRQRVLVEAINRKWVLTSKVANPKNPQYPVTAIKTNRPLPEVRQLLEQAGGLRAIFAPITISGERLSETVLRERR